MNLLVNAVFDCWQTHRDQIFTPLIVYSKQKWILKCSCPKIWGCYCHLAIRKHGSPFGTSDDFKWSCGCDWPHNFRLFWQFSIPDIRIQL